MNPETVLPSETDDNIKSSFTETYVYKTYLKNDSVKAEVKDGVATLTGTVSENSHRILAQDTMADITGVTRVNNQLETKAEVEVAADDADTWIGRKVGLALLFHRSVSYADTDICVKDGIVTLKGNASNEAQKELTTEFANDIEGVKKVINEMTVTPAPKEIERTEGEKIDDASVTALVKTALVAHRSTSAVKTNVKTREGEVTLTGIAQNAAEKALVTKLITDVKGVNTVKNLMTVN